MDLSIKHGEEQRLSHEHLKSTGLTNTGMDQTLELKPCIWMNDESPMIHLANQH